MSPMPPANPASTPPLSSALTAFLHGIEPRAWVFALSQCGDPERANAAMASALHDFVARARSLPLAQWPIQFWTSLLKQPLMLVELDPDLDLAQLSPGSRAALLLRLIAGLDFNHAADVIGVSPQAYEAALNHALTHPDMSDTWMQELREELHDLIHKMPPDQRRALAELREQALAWQADEEVLLAHHTPAPTRRQWWAWGVLVTLLVVLVASFLLPFGSSIRPGQSEALPVESVAPPPALTDSVIVTHPDYAQLAAPDDDALAQQMAFLSWVAAADPTVRGNGPDPLPLLPAETLDALPPAEQALLASARSAWPALVPETRRALLTNAHDWQSRTPAQRDALRKRVSRWDRLSATERARQRTPFEAWLQLGTVDRERLRLIAGHVAKLPVVEQTLLREQFAALPADEQRLWWLGPAMGQELMPIAALFAYMPEAERPALLLALRGLDADARHDLALLSPRLNEAQRQRLRRDLLAAPAAQRAALISRQLAR